MPTVSSWLSLLLSLALVFASQAVRAETCELAVIPSHQQQRGCGCNFYLPKQGQLQLPVVLQTDLYTQTPRMLRAKELVKLGGSQKQAFVTQAGDKQVLNYHYGNEAVRLEMVAAPQCEFGQPGCEVVGYFAELSIASNYQQCRWLLHGDCGC